MILACLLDTYFAKVFIHSFFYLRESVLSVFTLHFVERDSKQPEFPNDITIKCTEIY